MPYESPISLATSRKLNISKYATIEKIFVGLHDYDAAKHFVKYAVLLYSL